MDQGDWREVVLRGKRKEVELDLGDTEAKIVYCRAQQEK